jgi:hypothetical protein
MSNARSDRLTPFRPWVSEDEPADIVQLAEMFLRRAGRAVSLDVLEVAQHAFRAFVVFRRLVPS